MVQVIPQFQINEIFEQSPDATTNALRALLIGPDYAVRKYEDGKAAVSLGAYADEDLAVSWPGRLAGEVVDQAFTSVKIDSAALLYHTDQTDTESVSGKNNRIRSATKSWADNGTTYPRSVSVPCDVKVGDWIRCSIGSTTQISRVTRLIAEIVAATTGVAAADAGNIATAVGSSSATDGGSNAGTAVSSIAGASNPADYHGENVGTHGQMSETYTLTVVNVGAQGTGITGTWSTVSLLCTSTSGTDPDMFVTPIPATLVSIGSRGAQFKLSHGGAGDDFVLGDVFTVAVTQAYTIPTKTAAGTYTGTTDTTYVVRCTKGGLTDGTAQVTVSTADGSDASGPHAVTTATPIVIGNFGISITLTGANLVVGDAWTIAVTAAANGAIKTLELANDLVSGLRAATLKVELAILKNIDVSKNRLGHAPETNWDTSATEITLNAGILSTDDRVADTDLEVLVGNAYVSYRALRTATANVVRDISTIADVSTYFGGLDDPDSVMSYAALRALSNAGGTVVKAITLATDDAAGYTAALARLKEREDFYRIVPLTHDEAAIDLCIGVANQRSGQDVGRWATVMMALAVDTTAAIATGGTATITDDPDTSGTQYTLVYDAAGQFITLGVVPGDKVRALYTTDGFGGSSYTEFVVDTVVAEEKILLVSGPGTAVNVASKYEVWRDLSTADQVADWGERTQARSNRRVTSVFPPLPGRVGETVPSYFLAASLAALRGASAPHQGLTNAAVADWDDLTQASETYGDQLDLVANYGGYIVTESPSGEVYIRKQLTTDLTDTKRAEDSATVNVDSIAYYFKNLFAPKVGRSNVVPSNLDGLRADALAGINYLKTASFTTELGAQVTDGTLDFLRPHATLLDKVVARMHLTIPIPLNNGVLDIIV